MQLGIKIEKADCDTLAIRRKQLAQSIKVICMISKIDAVIYKNGIITPDNTL